MDGKASRGDFLIGGRQTVDAEGRYVGGMSMAEMMAYKNNRSNGGLPAYITATGVSIEPTPDTATLQTQSEQL